MSDPFATPERRALRELTRRFTEREVLPQLDAWERQGEVPRELHRTAAKIGLLGIGFPESVGGSGGDLLDTVIVTEELVRAGASSGLMAALFTHGIALPHIIGSGDRYLIDRYVRPTLAGEKIGALAVTEPDGGSDVAGIRTTARCHPAQEPAAPADRHHDTPAGDHGAHHDRHGGDPDDRPDGGDDHFVVNGTKTYITSGVRADFVVVAARLQPRSRTPTPGTQDPEARGRARGGRLGLFVIDKDTPGFTVTRRLEKMGWHCSDTAELSLVDVSVPASHQISPQTDGFDQLIRHFTSERISLAVQAYATAERCLELTLTWTKQRHTFGRPLARRQAIRHRLAEMARKIDVARSYVRQTAVRVASGEPLVTEVAMAKNTAVEACDHVVDEAVQLHGGLGYLRDAEVERHYRDSRILGIGGGTTEIMNEIIAKQLGV